MEVGTALIIILFVFCYLNLWLIIKKEKPTIIINNIIKEKDEAKKPKYGSKYVYEENESAKEIPAESHIKVQDIKGTVKLSNERVGTIDVSDLKNKVKELRNK